MAEPGCPRRTAASLAGAAAALALAAVLVTLLVTGPAEEAHERVVLLGVGAALLLMGGRLAFANCVESRFACLVLALAVLAGACLDVTLGLPGGEPRPAGAVQLALVALSLAVVVALKVDSPARRRVARP